MKKEITFKNNFRITAPYFNFDGHHVWGATAMMLAEFKVRHQLSPTGDVGYYHTLVVDGPIFKKRLQILKTADVYAPRAIRNGLKHDGVWYLDILECGLGIKDSGVPAAGIESESKVLKSTNRVGCFDHIQ